ncbi:GNAT family N-acetyltransferase [Yoonia sp. R2-816]|uniref:GNAT family N-acetyltransferase n=1 Tax=Yoonia sp. R2-816 TaxID=3342638 RepID=UPI00372A18D3
MTITVRPATADDAHGLTACIDAAYAPYVAKGLDLPPVSEGIAGDIRDHHVWVATRGDRIVGGIVLVLDDTAHLANLAVHPDAGGQGLGQALIATATSAARAAGYDRLHLATHIEMTGTQGFYLRLGWVEAGRDGNKVYFEMQL